MGSHIKLKDTSKQWNMMYRLWIQIQTSENQITFDILRQLNKVNMDYYTILRNFVIDQRDNILI